MEEYNALVVLQDKWPLLVAIGALIVTIFVVTEIKRRKGKSESNK